MTLQLLEKNPPPTPKRPEFPNYQRPAKPAGKGLWWGRGAQGGPRPADPVQRPGINWTGRVPRFRPKIGVDLRLSAADELSSRAFASGRHLSLAADERR